MALDTDATKSYNEIPKSTGGMMATSTDVKTETTIQVKPVNLWRVLLLNDDFTPMEFVISVLTDLYNKDPETAEAITMAVHNRGKGVAGVYVKEIALQKAKDTVAVARAHGHPLMAVAEES